MRKQGLGRREPGSVDNLPDDVPYRRIAAAVLLRALRDAWRGDTRAACWLQGTHAAAWARLLDLERWPPTDELLKPQKPHTRQSLLHTPAPVLVGAGD